MLQLTTGSEVGEAVHRWRANGETLAYVPTMGNLHAGHMRLVHAARARADRVIVSIFVNPLQFNDQDDYASYPRTLEQDHKLLAQDVDALFVPTVAEIYPRGMEMGTRIEVPGLSNILCGEYRPGHFIGVATIVAALFNLVRPDYALFGEKDYQQLLIIRRMAEDLHFPVMIVSVETVREKDGLAFSSRNRHLSPESRRRAPALYRILCELRAEIQAGTRDYHKLTPDYLRRLEADGFHPEYLSIRRDEDLTIAGPDDHKLRLLVAAWLDRTRLIDNISLDLSSLPG